MTALGYSLACYSNDGLRSAQNALPYLQSLGFPWVVFTPTYGVDDGTNLRLVPELAVDIGLLKEAIAQASQLGFHIRLEPHLDWRGTLSGGPYEWRRRMYFSPGDAMGYAEQILQPLAEFANGLLTRVPEQRIQITLGAELDVSLLAFAQQTGGWNDTATSLRSLFRGELGHKVNHDLFDFNDSLKNDISSEQTKRGLDSLGGWGYRRLADQAKRYLSTLDYVGVSFYPELSLERDTDWWERQADSSMLDEIASSFGDAMEQQARPIEDLSKPEFSIGEFGLGSADPLHSYVVDASTFLTADGSMDPGKRELRRNYYLGFLRSLPEFGSVLGSQPACFWTVTHYDIVQAMWKEGLAEFADPILVSAVSEYNRARALHSSP